MVVIKRPVNEEFENDLQNLNDQYQELKAQVSEYRKKGFETEIVEILLMDFPSKLKMAKATYEAEDVAKLRLLLDNIKTELQEVKDGSDFSHILEKIEQAYDFLRNDDFNEAASLYSQITLIYNKLPEDLRRVVFRACLEIREKIDDCRKAIAEKPI